jgi:Holliday junction resolvase RusA-like endonuclease
MGLPKGLVTGVTARLPGIPGPYLAQEPVGRTAVRPRAAPALAEETRVVALFVVLPLPPRELQPNAARNVHWARKARAVRNYRGEAKLAAEAARRQAGMVGSWSAATVQVIAFFRDRRRRDRDNLIGALKAAFDGLADAGVVANDAGFTYPPPLICKGSDPRIVLKITKTGGES